MARKGENIYKRKDGRWEGRYIKNRKNDGRIVYGYIYDKTYNEVKDRLLSMKYIYRDISHNAAEFEGTLGDWAACCMEDIVKSDIKQSTYAYYSEMLDNHILPQLGDQKLAGLDKNDIQKFVDTLSQSGLGAGAVQGVFGLLNRFFKTAVKKEVLTANPCTDISFPKKTKANIMALTASEQKQLERAALQDKNGIAVILALYTGMRIGEICALKWSDMNLEIGILHVQRTMQRIASPDENRKTMIVFDTPKSEKSDRLIPLPPKIRTLLSDLQAQSKSEFVVYGRSGYAEPRIVRHRFYKILKNAGIRHIHFHALRHTFATRCMELQFDVTTLSRLLGHSSVKMTLDIYTDSVLEHKITAMQKLDKLF